VVPVTVKVRHLLILCLFAAILSRIPLNENHIRLKWILYACSFGRLLKKNFLTSSQHSSHTLKTLFVIEKTSLGKKIIIAISVADPDPGSAAFFTPGSGMIFPDPGPRTPDPIFDAISESLIPIFGVKMLKLFAT
jgi:hypothetical protein